MTSLPERLLDCTDPLCVKINSIYQRAGVLDKQMLLRIVREIRKNPKLSASDLAERIKMARATLFYKLKKLGLTYQELVNGVIREAEEKYRRKLERRKVKRLPPRDKREFLEREIVQTVIKRMKSNKKKPEYIDRVISYWYRVCKYLGLAPEDFIPESREDQEKLWNLMTQYISDRADEGFDIRNDISMLQSIQKWLGTQILAPGTTQSEYQGRYQEAEIDFEHRNKIVKDLLELYKKTRDISYIRTIQAMIFLYYTGSRRQALTNFIWGETVKIRLKDFTDKFGEERFKVVTTTEKRGIQWKKLIPYSYYEILPQRPFSQKEISRIMRILKEALMKYYDEYNEHTKLYLDKSKVFHIWRHTACREYLKAFKYNRALVSKLLGWKKESNLVIYGDYTLLELLNVMAEEHKIQFVSQELYQELRRIILRSGLA